MVGTAAAGSEMGRQWRQAAQVVTVRREEKPGGRKKTKKGGEGSGMVRFTARGMVEEYLALCRHSAGDLRRWMAEDKRRPTARGRQIQTTTRREGNDASKQEWRGVSLADTYRLRRQSLSAVRGWLDTYRDRGRSAHGVPARSGAGLGRYDQLRSLRDARTGGERDSSLVQPQTGGGRDDAKAVSLAFQGARSVLHALYGARIEATRRSMPAREIAAAVRALVDERRAALRAVAVSRQSAQRGLRERRTAERFSARLAVRRQAQERKPAQTASPTEARPS